MPVTISSDTVGRVRLNSPVRIYRCFQRPDWLSDSLPHTPGPPGSRAIFRAAYVADLFSFRSYHSLF